MAAFRALPSPSQSPPSLAAEQALKPPASRQTDPLSGSNTTTPAATGQASRRPSFHEFVSYFGPQDDEQTIERGATTTFQFVNTTKNRRRPTPGVITLARSHVARGSHQNETAKTSQHQDTTQPRRRKEKRRVVPDELRIEPVPLSARGTMEISPPPPGMAKALFGSPVEVREGDQIMIDHLLLEVSSTFYPSVIRDRLSFNPAATSYARACFSSKIMYSSMIASSACCLHYYRGKNLSFQAHKYKGEALAVLRAALTKEAKRPSTALVGAVSWLGALATALGNTQEWSVHMKGVADMLNLRGGLSTIDQDLRNFVFQSDVEGAANSGLPLHLPPLIRSRPPLSETLCSDRPFINSCTAAPMIEILRIWDVNYKIMSTFYALSRFSKALSFVMMHENHTLDPVVIDEDMLLMQYDLASSTASIDGKPLDMITQLGLIVYTKSFTRGFPFSSVSSKDLIPRFHNAMQDFMAVMSGSDAETNLPQHIAQTQFQLWLAVMGAMASSEFEPTESKWWVNTAKRLADQLSLGNDWQDIKRGICDVLWVDEVHDIPLKQLWDSVGNQGRIEETGEESRVASTIRKSA